MCECRKRKAKKQERLDKQRNAIEDNGYRWPAPTKSQQLKALGRFVLTPAGMYYLTWMVLVVAFGGMLTLVMLGAHAPGLDKAIWVEVDSQVLNGLFCLTGLCPCFWRFRNVYFLLGHQLGFDKKGLRKLAGFERAWFRLPGSQDVELDKCPKKLASPEKEGFRTCYQPESLLSWMLGKQDEGRLRTLTAKQEEGLTTGAILDAETRTDVPWPIYKLPDCPLSRTRAQATKPWKLPAIIWLKFTNTAAQVALCYFMWAYDAATRPQLSTPILVVSACGVAIIAGVLMSSEITRIGWEEGVPWPVDSEKQIMEDQVEKWPPPGCRCRSEVY